jgi:hypothetical protein
MILIAISFSLFFFVFSFLCIFFFRLYVISRFKNLQVLDDSRVTEAEREESKKLYGTLRKNTLQTEAGRLTQQAKKKV